MILDRLENFEKYAALAPRFAVVAKYLAEHDITKLEPGKHEVLPNGELFINVNDSTLKPSEDAVCEFHRKYIDVQIPFDHYDRMGWMPLAEAPQEMQYNAEKDCALLKHRTACEVTVRPGEFIIFCPQDVHAPCLGEGKVRKAIIKILAD